MGSFASKLVQNVPEKLNIEEHIQKHSEDDNLEEQESIPSTPILTPKASRELTKDNLDPRSPSKHIARTPIEILSATTEKLKILASNNAETPLKAHILLGFDPRSPTFDFQRTPIIISTSPDKNLPDKIRNKNLDKVRKCTLPNTPNNKVSTPILLESCPITPKPKSDIYKRKSFVLLETNIDFTETDLDTVLKEKYQGKSLQELNASREPLCNEISDPRSPTTDFLRTPIQICQKENLEDVSIQTIEECTEQTQEKNVEELIKNLTSGTCVDIDKLSSSPIQPEPINLKLEEKNVENILAVQVNDQSCTESESQDCDNEQPLDATSENVLINNTTVESCVMKREATPITPNEKTLDEAVIVLQPFPSQNLQCQENLPKSAPVSPPNNIPFTPKKSKSQPVTPPVIDLTADVKELDKKLTHLIYEDEKDLVVCPRIVKVKDQNRTPLGLRNGNDIRKSTQKLKVSDKPRKAEYAVSKIPVFKEKKIKVQCENTPPRSLRPKKSQWDAKDDTLVI